MNARGIPAFAQQVRRIPTLDGGTCPGWGYLPWMGVSTLDRGYLPWMGVPTLGVPTLDGRYLPKVGNPPCQGQDWYPPPLAKVGPPWLEGR